MIDVPNYIAMTTLAVTFPNIFPKIKSILKSLHDEYMKYHNEYTKIIK